MIKFINYIIKSYFGLILSIFSNKDREIWLIGGHGGNLYDDNSKAIYEYLNKNNKDIDIYWVVNKNADCINTIANDGKFIEKGSLKNYYMFFKSKVVIFSHSLSSDIAPYIYIIPGTRRKYNSIKKVFLGHGVDGLKKKIVVDKGLSNLKEKILKSYDMYCSVSEFEKSIKVNEWGVDSNKVKITGLPRFDKLSSSKKCGFIFYMPTWRNWIDDKNFEESDYYKNIISLANNKKLHKILIDNNLTLNIYIHQLMHKYFDKIKLNLPNIKILNTNTNVQSQLLECNLLITDYSSVCWDVLYMNKPIIFYQFDINKYEDNIGSYINLRNDLFGDTIYNEEDCILNIKKYVDNSFKLDNKYINMQKKYIKYKDVNNCERVINEIKNLNC